MTDETTQREAMLDLAARAEAASGADRELDAAIAPLQGLRIVDEGHPIGRMCYDDIGCAHLLPRFTASLDAAMTLVPEGPSATGERFSVEHWDASGVHASHVRASAWVSGAPRVYAATPALALTAAALRARAAIRGDSNAD